MIKSCLNDAWILEYFEDICDDSGGGFPWVTVFKEEKKCDENFQPIDNDTIIIFCMLCEEPFEDSSYLGHLLASRKMTWQQLIKAAVDLMHFEEHEFKAFLQAERISVDNTVRQLSDRKSVV